MLRTTLQRSAVGGGGGGGSGLLRTRCQQCAPTRFAEAQTALSTSAAGPSMAFSRGCSGRSSSSITHGRSGRSWDRTNAAASSGLRIPAPAPRFFSATAARAFSSADADTADAGIVETPEELAARAAWVEALRKRGLPESASASRFLSLSRSLSLTDPAPPRTSTRDLHPLLFPLLGSRRTEREQGQHKGHAAASSVVPVLRQRQRR